MTLSVRFDLALLADPDTNPPAHRREWTRVYDHYTPRLDSYLAGRVPAADDREDIIAHVWYKALLHVHTLSGSSVLWNWLRQVADNRLKDLRRSAAVAARQAQEHSAEIAHEGRSFPEASALDRLAHDPLDGPVGLRFAALSWQDQELVRLVTNDVPHEEIAAQLGLPSAAASRQRWQRIRRKLKGSDG